MKYCCCGAPGDASGICCWASQLVGCAWAAPATTTCGCCWPCQGVFCQLGPFCHCAALYCMAARERLQVVYSLGNARMSSLRPKLL